MKKSVVVMKEEDNVATAVRDLKAGEKISIDEQEINVIDPILFGHKIAIKNIVSGSEVKKYGEIIGKATKDISIGEHVHVHNVDGCRGRGDQKEEF